MSTYRFTTALNYTFAQLTEMHNISFTGYFFPMDMTPESTATMYRVYQVAPQHCIAMHTEDGAFVGFAKLALRGNRAWCAGFGIAPTFRGQGMGKLLVTPMIEEARKAGAATLQLEVLAQNTAAFKLYSSAGFTVTRQLVGTRTTEHPGNPARSPHHYRPSQYLHQPGFPAHRRVHARPIIYTLRRHDT